MLSALAITLREGMEAALVLGIILTYLHRTGRTPLNRYVYWGLGLAVLVSLAAAAVLPLIGFDPENEFLEGTLLAIGGVFVASMVLWMWRAARNLRQHMETRMENIVAPQGETSWRAGMGLLAFTFFMVAREGMETVLFLAAATLGETPSILDFIGGGLGIALAALFAILFVRGSLKINLGRFFTVTTVVLLLLAAKLLAGSLHEFAEVGAIPMNAEVMRALGYFVRDRASSLILTGLIVVPILVVLWDFRKSGAAPASPGMTGAEQRKRRATRRWEQTWQASLLGATVVIALALGSQAFAASPFIDSPPQPIASLPGEAVKLDTGEWQPGELHKFAYQSGDATVRFLAVKLADGSIATAVDACQICGIEGFMQSREGPFAICKTCNAPIPMNTLGQGGGCNPLPLPSRAEGATALVIPLDGLQRQSERFSIRGK